MPLSPSARPNTAGGSGHGQQGASARQCVTCVDPRGAGGGDSRALDHAAQHRRLRRVQPSAGSDERRVRPTRRNRRWPAGLCTSRKYRSSSWVIRPGMSSTPPIRLAKRSRCGVIALRRPTNSRFIAKDFLELCVVGADVDPVLERGRSGRRSRRRSGRSCRQARRRCGTARAPGARRFRSASRSARRISWERLAVVVVDGDEIVGLSRRVHLDQVVLVARGPVDDEEDYSRRIRQASPAGRRCSESSTASGWNLNTSRRTSKSSGPG